MPLIGQYEYVVNKEHPRAFSDGRVFKHIVVAEKKIGRFLLPDEVVHHKNKNKRDNDPENLIVFATESDHVRFHNYGCDESYLVRNLNGSHSCKAKVYTCADCGAVISNGTERCIPCNNLHKRKTDWPSAEELYEYLKSIRGNFSEAALHFGVSDNAVRKWCDAYNLPRHSKDYR